MVAIDALTVIWDNIGVYATLAGGIVTVLAKQVKNHGGNATKLNKIGEYINELHDFTVNNHDKFVTAVKAVGDISPEFKNSIEQHGADIDKIAADSEIGKKKLQQVLDELNDLVK